MIRRIVFFYVFICARVVCAADEITLYNTTPAVIYVQPCYLKNLHEPCLHAGTAIELAPYSCTVMPRPTRHYHWSGIYDRCLSLTCVPDVREIRADTHALVPIGTLQGSDFFLDNRDGILRGYNAITWNSRMVYEALEAACCYMIEEVRQEHGDHSYHTMQAMMRKNDALCSEESAYVRRRAEYAQGAAEKLIPGTGDAWPRIALCTSGGGYRAMISTLGWLVGADKIGLLDATTYIAGVSGSTWAIAGFIESGSTIHEHINVCIDHIESSFLYDHDSDQVADALLKQFVFTQHLSFIDFYGALLAQKILKPYVHNPHEIDLASQADKISDGKQLFPLYTAVLDVERAPYEWVEFSPYEVSSSYLGAAIPTWAFGRTFLAGVSTNYAPSQSLGLYMGIWGSAVSANLNDLVQRYAYRLAPDLIARLLQKIVEHLSLAEGRITAAQVPNWTFGTDLPYAHHKTLQLLDAGLDGNLPLPALLDVRRKIDLIIVLDATYLGDNGSELVRAQLYAQRHQLPFPPIDYAAISQPCSVHADWGNPNIPVILYLPLRKHADYQQGWDPYQHNFTSTFNFKYTKEQMRLLSGLTEHSMVAHREIIFDTIARVIARTRRLQVN